MNAFPQIEEIRLQFDQIVSRAAVSDAVLMNCRTDVVLDEMSRNLILTLKRFIAYRPMDGREFRWPATWWDAVKQRFAPAWFLKRYPVQENVVKCSLRELWPDFPLPQGPSKYGRYLTVHVTS
jgi:hypothetical protein